MHWAHSLNESPLIFNEFRNTIVFNALQNKSLRLYKKHCRCIFNMLTHKSLEKEAYQEFGFPFSCKQRYRSWEAKSEAIGKLLGSDSIDSYILDIETPADNSLNYRHTRNSICDHKLQIERKKDWELITLITYSYIFLENNGALHSTMGLYNRSLHNENKVKISTYNLKNKIWQLIY